MQSGSALSGPRRKIIRFGDFEVDANAGEIFLAQKRLKLAPKPMQLLLLLAGNPGSILSRDEIRTQLWEGSIHVDFNQGLNFCIRCIREVLGDDASHPRYVETLPRRGYRFIAAVETVPSNPYPISQPTSHSLTPADHLREETLKAEAYEYYTRARKSLRQHGKESLEEARVNFEKAISLDPGYAMAHSGLGATYALRNLNRRLEEDLKAASFHLKKALELDPEVAEPYPWLCFVQTRFNALDSAVEFGKRGVALQPDMPQAHYFLALAYFCYTEADPAQFQNSLNALLTAARVGPGWQATWYVLAYIAVLNGDYDHANAFSQRLLAAPPAPSPFIGAELVLGTVALRRGQPDDARSILNAFIDKLENSDHMYRDSMATLAICCLGDVELRHGTPAVALSAYRRAWHLVGEHTRMMAQQRISAQTQAGLAAAYAAAGDLDRAATLLDSAINQTAQCSLPQHAAAGSSLSALHYAIAVACLRTGRPNQALDELQRACQCGWNDAKWLATDPEWASLRSDFRFQSMLAELRNRPPLNYGDSGIAHQP